MVLDLDVSQLCASPADVTLVISISVIATVAVSVAAFYFISRYNIRVRIFLLLIKWRLRRRLAGTGDAINIGSYVIYNTDCQED